MLLKNSKLSLSLEYKNSGSHDLGAPVRFGALGECRKG